MITIRKSYSKYDSHKKIIIKFSVLNLHQWNFSRTPTYPVRATDLVNDLWYLTSFDPTRRLRDRFEGSDIPKKNRIPNDDILSCIFCSGPEKFRDLAFLQTPSVKGIFRDPQEHGTPKNGKFPIRASHIFRDSYGSDMGTLAPLPPDPPVFARQKNRTSSFVSRWTLRPRRLLACWGPKKKNRKKRISDGWSEDIFKKPATFQRGAKVYKTLRKMWNWHFLTTI